MVKLEDTTSACEGRVIVRRAPSPGQWVRQQGCDIAQGQTILPVRCTWLSAAKAKPVHGTWVSQVGHALTPTDIGLLATVGVSVVQVCRKPRVAILSTGDELVDYRTPDPV